jgi:hypothetical protein
MPIVEHQPNKNFIENLKPGSLFLRNLQQNFTRAASQLRGSRVVSIAELGMSKTAKVGSLMAFHLPFQYL